MLDSRLVNALKFLNGKYQPLINQESNDVVNAVSGKKLTHKLHKIYFISSPMIRGMKKCNSHVASNLNSINFLIFFNFINYFLVHAGVIKKCLSAIRCNIITQKELHKIFVWRVGDWLNKEKKEKCRGSWDVIIFYSIINMCSIAKVSKV